MSLFEPLLSEEEFKNIVSDNLFIDTLETRKADSLDFFEASVWGIDNALYKAYMLGVKHTTNQSSSTGA